MSSGVQKNLLFESPYMTSYLTSMDNISLSCAVFEIHSTLKFLGFNLDLGPPKVIWSRKKIIIRMYDFILDFYGQHFSISHRFQDIHFQRCKCLTLTFVPKKSSVVKNFNTIRKPIYDSLFDFYEHHLSISHRSRDSRNQRF